MISNTLSSGLEGVRNGTLGMQDAANRIARNGTTEGQRPADGDGSGQQQPSANAGGLAEPIVDLKLSQRNVEASVEVVKAADEMVGTLLDERA